MKARWQLAGLGLGMLLVSACAAAPSPTPRPSPSPTSNVQGSQTPAVAPSVTAVAVASRGYCDCYTLSLLSLSGTQLASVTLADGAPLPPLQAGSGGLYYVSGGQLLRLGTDGSRAALGAVAADPTGASVVASPERAALAVNSAGTEWGYLQALGGAAAGTQQLWLGEPGQSPRLLLTASAGSGPSSTEFPSGSTYQLLGWADGSLVLAEAPSGQSSFPSSALELFLVNPQTGRETLLDNSTSCPVAAVTASGDYFCVQQGGGQATLLMEGAGGVSSGAWSLPSGSGYGALQPEPAGALLLLTSCPGCGASASSAYAHGQLEIFDPGSGQLSPVGPTGLVGGGWVSTGELAATQYSEYYPSSTAAPESEVVLVSVATGKTTALTDDRTSELLGLATS